MSKFKRRNAALISTVYLSFGLFINAPGNTFEINCDSSVWRDKEECSKSRKNKKTISNKIPKAVIGYPIELEKIGFLDLATGKAVPAKLNANNKSQITITKEDGKKLSIDPTLIIEWSVGDYSKKEFSGTKALASVAGSTSGALAGALLFPSPATPLLLLLSPAIGLSTGNNVELKPEWRIAIRTIGLDGKEQLTLIQALAEEDTSKIRFALEKSTDLLAGQRRGKWETGMLLIRNWIQNQRLKLGI